ncbi:MAG: hypothetical protein AAF108_10830 [Planctomycetota bacterium]
MSETHDAETHDAETRDAETRGDPRASDDAKSEEPGSPPTATKTRPATMWLLKTLLMTLVPVGLGAWGVYDAFVAYPNRGERVASYRLLEYLEAARPAYGWDGPVGVPVDEDPAEVMGELRDRRSQLETAVTSTNRADAEPAREQLALLDYLEALNVMFRLTTERAHIDDPGQTLTELRAKWVDPSGQPRSAPKPLEAYDIPVQYIFIGVGVGAAFVGTAFMTTIMSKTYRFDPDTLRLTLPTGETIVPEQVAEFDKRKWDKFLIFLKMKENHESLAGRELKLDLYRYDPLEAWVIEMHRSAFPEDFEEEDAEASAAEAKELASVGAGDGSPEDDDGQEQPAS